MARAVSGPAWMDISGEADLFVLDGAAHVHGQHSKRVARPAAAIRANSHARTQTAHLFILAHQSSLLAVVTPAANRRIDGC